MLAPHSPTRARAPRSRTLWLNPRICLCALLALAALGALAAVAAPASAKLLAFNLLPAEPPPPTLAPAPVSHAYALAPASLPAQVQTASGRAFVTTDQTDYKPGETVVIFGSGWTPNEIVTLTIHDESGASADAVLTAEADEYGNIMNKEFSPTEAHLGASFRLTAAGQSSGRTAEAKFTDGGTMSYSPNSVALTAFSGPSGSTTTGFAQTVTAPGGNGNFNTTTVVTPVSVGGSLQMPAAWVTAASFTGQFSTGPAQNPKPDSKTRNVSVAPPANTPPGVYTSVITVVAPANLQISTGQGTLVQLTVTADNAPLTTTLSAVDSNNNPYGGVLFTNANKVTITLTATDAGGSGINATRYKIDNQPFQNYNGPFDIAAEGVSVVTYFSTDNTGAQETAKFFTVKIDKTAPAVNCGAADGLWHAADVSVPCTAADGGGQQKSGLANASDASFSLTTNVPAGTEDANASTDSRQVCDNADNCSTAGPVAGNMIDKKAPTVTASAAKADSSPYTAGVWVNQNVIVSYNCTDAGSGVASVDGPTTVSAEGANQSATGNCADNVGNSASATFAGIYIDKTKPTLTFDSYLPAPNAAGWNNTNVAVAFTAADALSGVAAANPSSPLVLSAEGAAVTGSVLVTDVAGNSDTFTSAAVKIDKTAPAVQITSPANTSYFLNQAVAANYACSDALSGVAACAGPVASGANIDTAAVGPHTFTVNATDVAGNSASDARTYGVVYEWSGFLQPINAGGGSVFKLGSTVPVKFRLTGGSAGVTNATNFQLFVAKVSNNVVGTEVEAVTSTPSSVGNLFRYDATGGLYIYNMGTKGAPWSAGTYQLRVDLGDGVANRTVLISLKP